MFDSALNYINQKTLVNCYSVNPYFDKNGHDTFLKQIEKTKYNNFYIFKHNSDFCYTYNNTVSNSGISSQGDFVNQSIVVNDFYKKLDILNENPFVFLFNFLIIVVIFLIAKFISNSFDDDSTQQKNEFDDYI